MKNLLWRALLSALPLLRSTQAYPQLALTSTVTVSINTAVCSVITGLPPSSSGVIVVYGTTNSAGSVYTTSSTSYVPVSLSVVVYTTTNSAGASVITSSTSYVTASATNAPSSITGPITYTTTNSAGVTYITSTTGVLSPTSAAISDVYSSPSVVVFTATDSTGSTYLSSSMTIVPYTLTTVQTFTTTGAGGSLSTGTITSFLPYSTPVTVPVTATSPNGVIYVTSTISYAPYTYIPQTGGRTVIIYTTTGAGGSIITTSSTSFYPTISSATSSQGIASSISSIPVSGTSTFPSTVTSVSGSTTASASVTGVTSVVIETSSNLAGSVVTSSTTTVVSSIIIASSATTGSSPTSGSSSPASTNPAYPCPASIAQAYSNTNGVMYQIFCETDFLGFDLPSQNATTFAECITYCTSYVAAPQGDSYDSPCVAVTWQPKNTNGNNCYLRYGIGNVVYGDTAYDSAKLESYNPPIGAVSVSVTSISGATMATALPSSLASYTATAGVTTSSVTSSGSASVTTGSSTSTGAASSGTASLNTSQSSMGSSGISASSMSTTFSGVIATSATSTVSAGTSGTLSGSNAISATANSGLTTSGSLSTQMSSSTSLAASSTSSVLGSSVVSSVAAPAVTGNTEPRYSNGYAWLGCFNEVGISTRALTGAFNLTQSDVDTCAEYCIANGPYSYFYVEYYGECFCGNIFDASALPATGCTFPCNSNTTQTCGGQSVLDLYSCTTEIAGSTSTVYPVGVSATTTSSISSSATSTVSISSTNVVSSSTTTASNSSPTPSAGFTSSSGVMISSGATSSISGTSSATSSSASIAAFATSTSSTAGATSSGGSLTGGITSSTTTFIIGGSSSSTTSSTVVPIASPLGAVAPCPANNGTEILLGGVEYQYFCLTQFTGSNCAGTPTLASSFEGCIEACNVFVPPTTGAGANAYCVAITWITDFSGNPNCYLLSSVTSYGASSGGDQYAAWQVQAEPSAGRLSASGVDATTTVTTYSTVQRGPTRTSSAFPASSTLSGSGGSGGTPTEFTPCIDASDYSTEGIYVSGAGNSYDIYCGNLIEGYDLPSINVTSFEACVSACDNYIPVSSGFGVGNCVACNWGPFDANGNNCYRHSAVGTNQQSVNQYQDAAIRGFADPNSPNYNGTAPAITPTTFAVTAPTSSAAAIAPCPANNGTEIAIGGRTYQYFCLVNLVGDNVYNGPTATESFEDCIEACNTYVPPTSGPGTNDACVAVTWIYDFSGNANCFRLFDVYSYSPSPNTDNYFGAWLVSSEPNQQRLAASGADQTVTIASYTTASTFSSAATSTITATSAGGAGAAPTTAASSTPSSTSTTAGTAPTNAASSTSTSTTAGTAPTNAASSTSTSTTAAGAPAIPTTIPSEAVADGPCQNNNGTEVYIGGRTYQVFCNSGLGGSDVYNGALFAPAFDDCMEACNEYIPPTSGYGTNAPCVAIAWQYNANPGNPPVANCYRHSNINGGYDSTANYDVAWLVSDQPGGVRQSAAGVDSTTTVTTYTAPTYQTPAPTT
ncbi:hypothetical protein MMC25_004719 [Agyrium rufum]|nr:hypothetical protein [Agyrium rufum]